MKKFLDIARSAFIHMLHFSYALCISIMLGGFGAAIAWILGGDHFMLTFAWVLFGIFAFIGAYAEIIKQEFQCER